MGNHSASFCRRDISCNRHVSLASVELVTSPIRCLMSTSSSSPTHGMCQWSFINGRKGLPSHGMLDDFGVTPSDRPHSIDHLMYSLWSPNCFWCNHPASKSHPCFEDCQSVGKSPTLFGCTTRNPPQLYIHDILHHSAIIKPSFKHH